MKALFTEKRKWCAVALSIILVFGRSLSSPPSIEGAEQFRITEGRILQSVRIQAVEWQPRGNLIAVGDASNVWIYTSGTQQQIAHIPVRNYLQSIAWSPDGTELAMISDGGSQSYWELQIWSINPVERKITVGEDNISVFNLKVVWSPIDGILAISGTEEVQIRNTSNGALLKILHTSDYSPFDSAGIDWSPDGTKLVTANSGWLRIWNIDSGNILTSFSDGRNFESVAWSPDGNFIASTGGTDNDIAIGDVVSSELERTLRGHTGYISDLAWSTGGLASSSYDKTIRIWDVASGQTTEIIPTLNQVLSITWSPDGKMLAYGDGGLLKIARLQATDDG